MAINSLELCWSPSYQLLKSSLRGFPRLIPKENVLSVNAARLLLEAAPQKVGGIGETQMILSCQVLHKLKKSRNAVSLRVKAERQLLGFANEHRRNWPHSICFHTFSGRSQSRCATSLRFRATNEAVTS